VEELAEVRGSWRVLTGVFFVSFGVLMFEIALGRIFSVMFAYHYTFVILSMAIFGLGAGGLFVHLYRSRLPGMPVALAFSVPAVTFLLLRLPSFGGPRSLTTYVLASVVLSAVPFFFAGAVLSEIFRDLPRRSSGIYAVDLLGAALGALWAVKALNLYGGVGAALSAGVSVALGTFFLLYSSAGRTGAALGLIAATSAFLSDHIFGYYGPVSMVRGKELYDFLRASKAEIVENRWSAFGRTDLVKVAEDRMYLFVDGTAGTIMYRFDGKFERPLVENLKEDIEYFPFLFLNPEEKENALVIGSGGGRDVLLALLGGVGRITAVEVNPDIVALVKKYSDFNGGIYTGYGDVEVVVAEGRNYIKRSKDLYDLIILALPITKTSRSPEGYALTENYLFTVESIGDYLDHLTPEGRIIVLAHHIAEVFKLFSISVKALERMGVSNADAMDHMYMVGLSGPSLFVLKKSPFTLEESEIRHRSIHLSRYIALVKSLFFPNLWGCHLFDRFLVGVNQGSMPFDLIDLYVKSPVDLSPVTDDRPFFYKGEQGLPSTVMAVLLWATVLSGTSILLPSMFVRRERAKCSFGWMSLLFPLLGVGFMMAEISLIQKLNFFIGEPVISVAVLLSVLLAGGGIGSFLSGYVGSDRTRRFISLSALVVSLGIVAELAFLPALSRASLALSLVGRSLVGGMAVLPLGIAMGFPFPLGIKMLDRVGRGDLIPWMWGVNGAFSVLGSVLAIVIAITLGYSYALIASALCYSAVALLFRGFRARDGCA